MKCLSDVMYQKRYLKLKHNILYKETIEELHSKSIALMIAIYDPLALLLHTSYTIIYLSHTVAMSTAHLPKKIIQQLNGTSPHRCTC